MSVKGLQLLSSSLGLRYTDFIHSRVRFWRNFKSLDLSNLQLEDVPSELFAIDDVIIIDLSHNKISKLPDNFDTLDLRTLRLSSNRITIFPHLVVGMSNLREIYLGNNQLRNIPSQIARLSNLKLLDLRGNKIKTVPQDLCHRLHLKSLFLDGNVIENIGDMYFASSELNNLTITLNHPELLNQQLITELGEISYVQISFSENGGLEKIVNKMTAFLKFIGSRKRVIHQEQERQIVIT